MPFELLIQDAKASLRILEKLELRAYDNGHGYMAGIFNPGAADRDPVSRPTSTRSARCTAMRGHARSSGMNRHNTVIYGSGFGPQTGSSSSSG